MYAIKVTKMRLERSQQLHDKDCKLLVLEIEFSPLQWIILYTRKTSHRVHVFYYCDY